MSGIGRGAEVGVGGAEDRDLALGLRPRGRPGRVGVHDAADRLERPVEGEVLGVSVDGRRSPSTTIAVEVDEHDVGGGHLLVVERRSA